jgi:Tfp pilus assembly protein PilF
MTLGLACLSALAGCMAPPVPAPVAVVVEAPPERMAAPGEAALGQGIKAYQSGQYAEAEIRLKQALQAGLSVGVDQAQAHKHLAFIYCTSRREALCLSAFRSARQADPGFTLSKTEAGHPMWGKVYRRALALK